jgi:hypothetical protein
MQKKNTVIFKAKHSEKKILGLDGRILLNWISRILVVIVWIKFNWE